MARSHQSSGSNRSCGWIRSFVIPRREFRHAKAGSSASVCWRVCVWRARVCGGSYACVRTRACMHACNARACRPRLGDHQTLVVARRAALDARRPPRPLPRQTASIMSKGQTLPREAGRIERTNCRRARALQRHRRPKVQERIVLHPMRANHVDLTQSCVVRSSEIGYVRSARSACEHAIGVQRTF
eukprot:6213480-Pleurochrysis_carterae.AAC.1